MVASQRNSQSPNNKKGQQVQAASLAKITWAVGQARGRGPSAPAVLCTRKPVRCSGIPATLASRIPQQLLRAVQHSGRRWVQGLVNFRRHFWRRRQRAVPLRRARGLFSARCPGRRRRARLLHRQRGRQRRLQVRRAGAAPSIRGAPRR